MNEDRSKFTGEANDIQMDSGDVNDGSTGSSENVSQHVEQGQSLINEAKEMARRDWENQYEDSPSDVEAGSSSSDLHGTDLEAEFGGSLDDSQSDPGSTISGQHADLGGTIGDPTSDVDSEISNKQAGLGGAIGVPDDNLGGATGDDQINVGGEFNDARGGVGSESPRSADMSDAGLVTNDLQGAVDMNPTGDQTRLGGNMENVETTLTGGLGDEQSASASKFDSVRSEVERNFSDLSGNVDGGNSGGNTAGDAGAADAGDLRFGDTGVSDEAKTGADHLSSHADGLGDRARGAGADLKHRAAEAREQAAHRLEDVRRELGQTEGRSMVEDVQAKAKGLLNKVKDALDSNKKS